MRKAPWGGYGWLAPMFGFLLLFELWPFLVMLDQSVHFLNYTQPAKNGQFIGFDNYRKAVFDENFFYSIRVTLLFLDCEDEILARRYTETRRRHPLSHGRPAADGIAAERGLIAPLRARADLVIDTSALVPAECATCSDRKEIA